ncbi:MAG: DUF493 family protein [Bacteroidales bacterium]
MQNLNSLREKLIINSHWPLLYMFKFIVPAQMESIARVEALFAPEAIIYRKESRNKRFVSITAKQQMASADHIIGVYQQAGQIPGIMAL